HAVGVTQYRYDQTALGGYRHADVLITVIHHVVTVDRGVHGREAFQRFSSGFHEERHKAHLHAVYFLTLIFVLGTQIHHRLHVHFVVRCEQGRALLSFRQTLGNGGTQTGHRYAFFNTLTGR